MRRQVDIPNPIPNPNPNVGRVPLLEETKIRRGVSDGDALAVHQANQADTQLFMGMCAPAGARACDAIRGARSAARYP